MLYDAPKCLRDGSRHIRNDGRSLVGQMLAYDKHMNFVLAECEEFRTVKVGLQTISFQLDKLGS